MKCRFLILSLLLIIINFFYGNRSDSSPVTVQFEDFFIGMSYQEVVDLLKKSKAQLVQQDVRHFKMELPIYHLLDQASNSKFINFKKERIYYDNETFFDFKTLYLDNERYQFYYDDPHYLFLVKALESYSVDYPSRVNPKIDGLKLKFFHKILYAIEYSSKRLKPYEIQRIRSNYLQKYGVVLYKNENIFENSIGKYYVSFNKEENNALRIIIVGALEYRKIETYLDRLIYQLLYDLGVRINLQLYNVGSAKKLLLQQKKRHLLDKMALRYGVIDAL